MRMGDRLDEGEKFLGNGHCILIFRWASVETLHATSLPLAIRGNICRDVACNVSAIGYTGGFWGWYCEPCPFIRVPKNGTTENGKINISPAISKISLFHFFAISLFHYFAICFLPLPRQISSNVFCTKDHHCAYFISDNSDNHYLGQPFRPASYS